MCEQKHTIYPNTLNHGTFTSPSMPSTRTGFSRSRLASQRLSCDTFDADDDAIADAARLKAMGGRNRTHLATCEKKQCTPRDKSIDYPWEALCRTKKYPQEGFGQATFAVLQNKPARKRQTENRQPRKCEHQSVAS